MLNKSRASGIMRNKWAKPQVPTQDQKVTHSGRSYVSNNVHYTSECYEPHGSKESKASSYAQFLSTCNLYHIYYSKKHKGILWYDHLSQSSKRRANTNVFYNCML